MWVCECEPPRPETLTIPSPISGRTSPLAGGNSQEDIKLGVSKSSFLAFTFHVQQRRLIEEKFVNSDCR